MGMPPEIAPMLAGSVGIPTGPGPWLIEPKWDGIRAIVSVTGRQVRLVSRNGNDVTGAYPELQSPPAGTPDAVLDGEIVVVGADGRPDFGLLQHRMHVRNPAPKLQGEFPVDLILFDVLWLAGELLTGESQLARRHRLEDIITAPWATTPLLDLPLGPDLIQTGRDLNLEGFMIKRADAPYLPGRRSDAWAKVKCVRRREFVVGGWVEGKRSRTGELGSLALGVHDKDGRLLFVGLAGSGLSGADVAAFRATLRTLTRPASPFANPTPPMVKYLEPVLVAEVTFSEVTVAGTLRHPVLVGFRTDIPPDNVVIDGELAPFVG
jgi:bifunctional non-homologous end joining protein LigD